MPGDPIGYALVMVACETGRSVRQVALDSYAVTLFTFLQIEERNRLSRLIEERHRLDTAGLTAVAMWEPKKLAEFENRFRLKLRKLPSREQALRSAAALMKKIEQVEQPRRRRRKR